MNKKLSFEVENAEIIEEKPQSNFALLALDFFASGPNLHNMYVSEETLERTADTIRNCPLVWKYDEILDDIYTHDPDEVPCGFVPGDSVIESKKLEDGRTMLSVMAYVWKRYTGDLLRIFKRDNGKKPVSVEMSVYKTKSNEEGMLELLDYRYEGITILGSFVTPAIPMAGGTILSFAMEYEDDYEKEFSLNEIMIPSGIRSNAQRGLELRKQNGGGTSAAVAFARYLSTNKIITSEKIREIHNYFSTHKDESRIGENIDWLLWGGNYAKEWSDKMVSRIDEQLVTFPYKSKGDINPALKGINPPVSLAQANAIARQAESIGSDGEKNGWAIAISSFKKTHHVEDGKWVKNKSNVLNASEDSQSKERMEFQENTIEEEIANKKEMAMTKEQLEMAEESAKEEEVLMAEDTAKSEEVETKEEEKEETPVEEKKEEEKGIEKKFQMETMAKFFSDDETEEAKMAMEEMSKGDVADFGMIMNAIYNKFCKLEMAIKEYAEKESRFAKMEEEFASKEKIHEEERKAYMAENEELKKFKADLEAQQKNFAVTETIKELSASVNLPDDVRAEMIADAENYTLQNIEAWKNSCKAKSFDFAIKQPEQQGIVKIGLPFGNSTRKETDLWSN